MPSILHLVSVKRDVPAPINSAKGVKRALKDKGVKPNKKRKIKLL